MWLINIHELISPRLWKSTWVNTMVVWESIILGALDLFITRHIRRDMTNPSPTLYCICWVTVLSMSKRLKSAVAVFVFEQLNLIFLCVSAIHARRTICKDYVMICLSILYKTSLAATLLDISARSNIHTRFACKISMACSMFFSSLSFWWKKKKGKGPLKIKNEFLKHLQPCEFLCRSLSLSFFKVTRKTYKRSNIQSH